MSSEQKLYLYSLFITGGFESVILFCSLLWLQVKNQLSYNFHYFGWTDSENGVI